LSIVLHAGTPNRKDLLFPPAEDDPGGVSRVPPPFGAVEMMARRSSPLSGAVRIARCQNEFVSLSAAAYSG
jgi:hypothetical protein